MFVIQIPSRKVRTSSTGTNNALSNLRQIFLKSNKINLILTYKTRGKIKMNFDKRNSPHNFGFFSTLTLHPVRTGQNRDEDHLANDSAYFYENNFKNSPLLSQNPE